MCELSLGKYIISADMCLVISGIEWYSLMLIREGNWLPGSVDLPHSTSFPSVPLEGLLCAAVPASAGFQEVTDGWGGPRNQNLPAFAVAEAVFRFCFLGAEDESAEL